MNSIVAPVALSFHLMNCFQSLKMLAYLDSLATPQGLIPRNPDDDAIGWDQFFFGLRLVVRRRLTFFSQIPLSSSCTLKWTYRDYSCKQLWKLIKWTNIALIYVFRRTRVVSKAIVYRLKGIKKNFASLFRSLLSHLLVDFSHLIIGLKWL